MRTFALCTLVLMASAAWAGQDAKPWKMWITSASEPGIPMIVTGKVVDQEGKPLPNVKLYVYQTDASGLYARPGNQHGPRLKGTMWTNREGRFEFRTIRPGPYPGSQRGEHFHMTLTEGGIPNQFANIAFFEDRPIKLTIDVGREGATTKHYTGFAWKPDPEIKGQRLEIEIRVTR